MIEKIISGGQTGADQGALDAAIGLCFSVGGTAPKGFTDENGKIPSRYRNYLTECQYGGYPARTRKNVIDSDGTVIFYERGYFRGGTKMTADFCKEQKKHFMKVSIDDINYFLPDMIFTWTKNNAIFVLNVAGHRESYCPGIHERVKDVIEEVIKRRRNNET